MKRIIIKEEDFERVLDNGHEQEDEGRVNELSELGIDAIENLKNAIGRFYTLLGRGIPREPYAELWVQYLNPLRGKLMGIPNS